MNFVCHHWRSNDIFFETEREGIKQHKLVQTVQDFIDDAVFLCEF